MSDFDDIKKGVFAELKERVEKKPGQFPPGDLLRFGLALLKTEEASDDGPDEPLDLELAGQNLPPERREELIRELKEQIRQLEDA